MKRRDIINESLSDIINEGIYSISIVGISNIKHIPDAYTYIKNNKSNPVNSYTNRKTQNINNVYSDDNIHIRCVYGDHIDASTHIYRKMKIIVTNNTSSIIKNMKISYTNNDSSICIMYRVLY